ncbi:hypothetical protein B0H13DRAFT_1865678 [Mycena leptocephala]|nr:hypothetical protein B0H13DRAFT_1865678 [Mycena leptocephala]
MATDLWDEHNHAEAATEESLAAAGTAVEKNVMGTGGLWCRNNCGPPEIGTAALCANLGEDVELVGKRNRSARRMDGYGCKLLAVVWIVERAVGEQQLECWTCQVIASGVLVPATRELGGNARELGPNGSTRAGEQV